MAPTNPLRAERALVHPLWNGALVVLVVNDHVLKGADLLPGFVTGKLSDVAGLLVAPTLLAALARVRTRRGFALAHLATGVVFSALQLSASFAEALSFMLATTRDATDLLALFVLPVSIRVFGRAAATKRVHHHLQRTTQWSAATVGLLACMGTSPPERPEIFSDFWSDLYIHNPTSEETVVLVRLLRTDIDIDCDAIAQRPGELLTEDLFDTGRAWSVPPTANVPVRQSSPWNEEETPRECYAAWISGDTLSPHLAFWLAGIPAVDRKDGNTFNDDHAPGALVLDARDDDGGFRLDDLDREYLFDPVAPLAPSSAACALRSDADRLDWSIPLPVGQFNLDAVNYGPDGCAELEMGTTRWFLCVPPEVFPFAAGDRIQISDTVSGSPALGGNRQALSIQKLDPVDNTPHPDQTALVVSRGAGIASLFGLGATVQSSCELVADEGCGTVAATATISFIGAGGAVDVAPGAIESIAAPGSGTVTVANMHAQIRVLVDPACTLGTPGVGPDLEVAASFTNP